MHRTLIFVMLFASVACGGSNPSSPSSTPSPPAGQPGGSPRTYYVSTTGSDQNDGTIAAPWLTLRYAVAQLRAGDTLYLRGGTYRSQFGTENTIDSQLGTVRSGTSWSNAITIAGYPSETVTIRPPQSGNGNGIRLTTGSPQYLIFQDLIIDMIEQTDTPQVGPDGIYVGNGANHNRFQRLEIMNNYSNGIVFSDRSGNSSFNEVLNCRVHDNGRSNGINQGYGAYIQTSDNKFEDNEIYNNGGYGLHFYGDAGPQNVARNAIRRNNIHDNGTHGGNNYGLVVAWGDGNLIEANFIYGNRGGVLVYTNSSNTGVYGNTIHDNKPLEGILIQYATGAIVKDNVVYGNGTDIVDLGVGTILSNNHP